MPRGLSWNDVAAYGLFDGNTGNGAFRFTCTTGSFGYQFLNVIATGYDWAFVMTYPPSAGPGIEGVEFYNCQAYVGGQGLAFINNPLHDTVGYLPPQFNFYTCGVQGNGTAVSLIGLQDVVIDNLLTETEAHSYADKPMIDLSSCVDVWVNRCAAGINPAATHVTFARCNATCFNVNFDQNSIVNYGGMDYAYDWTGNPGVSNVIREFRTAFRQLPTADFITYDRNANQISEAWFLPYTLLGHQITVNQSGTYQVAGTSSGTTDAQGEISVTYPARPITGQPIFLLTPLVTVTPENLSHISVPPITIVARSRTSFTVKCLNTGAGIPVGLNYVAVGQ
jgi:hypothetical protein